jgi:long-subunit acyl-CoA synthetase (AMP-forming)
MADTSERSGAAVLEPLGHLLPADWLPDGDELTPTMKMRRRVIGSKYAATIEELYA